MDLIVDNIAELVTGSGFVDKDGRIPLESDLGIIKKAALVAIDGRVAFAGPRTKLSSFIKTLPKKKKFKEHNAKGSNVFPGFVEAHTHLVFAGDRKNEFELRNQGATYQEISAQGGGIKKTVVETRKASATQLKQIGQVRLDRFFDQGVTTVECKSGYGLDAITEEKILKVHRSLEGCRVISTFLGLHSLPLEYQNKKEAYVELMIGLLPQIKKKKLADRVDIFIEKGFFDRADAKKLFSAASGLGFSITAHTEQLSHTGGVENLIDANASSGDHLVEITDSEISRLSKSNTVAMLLPTSDFYLKIKYPPARKLIDGGAAVALATDFNPGTSPTQDLSLVGVLARLEMKMSLPEVFCAYTYNASKALGLNEKVGALRVNYAADFFISGAGWDDFFFEVGRHPVDFVHASAHK